MKMLWVTDSENGNKVAVSADKVILVFTVPKNVPNEGKTVIVLIAGQILVEESDIDIVGMLEAQ